jgi:hypothetical protein
MEFFSRYADPDPGARFKHILMKTAAASKPQGARRSNPTRMQAARQLFEP